MPQPIAPAPLAVAFVAGATGPWCIDRIAGIAGDTLAAASRLEIVENGCASRGESPSSSNVWSLRGIVGHARYSQRRELDTLAGRQEPLHRPCATRAALIPIRKTGAWWALAQDERRAVFEERSQHIRIGLDYLPAIARRLHHSRDLGEPFDFLTWFEYAPGDEPAFDEMLARLRSREEWTYVEREVDVRLTRDVGQPALGV